MQSGKSGGFRIIIYFDKRNPQNTWYMTLFAKKEKKNITSDEIIKIRRDIEKYIDDRKKEGTWLKK